MVWVRGVRWAGTGRRAADPYARSQPACRRASSLSDREDGIEFAPLQHREQRSEGRDGVPMTVPGAVEIRIVQEDHVAADDLAVGARDDPPGRRELPPVLAPAGP